VQSRPERNEVEEEEEDEGDYGYDGDEDDDDFDEEELKRANFKEGAMTQNDNEWMFFDVAKINVKGGDGGDGCMAMQREFRIAFGGPCGGNGGDGGSVYLQCDKRLNTLGMLRRRVHHKGRDGKNGLGDSRHGSNAFDVFVPVPPGTIVRDADGTLAGELNEDGATLLVARGGLGGRGNEHFKTGRNSAPAFSEKGEPGDVRWLQIELKLIADVGLVGVPNAGKSTLLAASTNAKPKIADYPFTTIVPNLGVCDLFQSQFQAGDAGTAPSLVLLDIPGLLEGAHEGVGLGIAFLRHIQRCRVLIHVVDGSSADPVGDFKAINQELELFNPALAQKTQVVIVNKCDLPEVRAKLPALRKQLFEAAGHKRILGISAAAKEGTLELMQRVFKLVSSMPAQSSMELFTQEEDRVSFAEDLDEHFDIQTDERFPGQFRVTGNRIEKVVAMTNWDYYESIRRFQRILEATGISKALKKAGAVQGDMVMVGEWDFNYWEPRNRWIAELGLDEINPRQRYGREE